MVKDAKRSSITYTHTHCERFHCQLATDIVLLSKLTCGNVKCTNSQYYFFSVRRWQSKMAIVDLISGNREGTILYLLTASEQIVQ